MRAKLIQIGNSRGVRLPKAIIEEAGLGDELEITVRDGAVVIARARKVREGWAEAFKDMAKREQHTLDILDAEFDELLNDLPDEDWTDFWKRHDP